MSWNIFLAVIPFLLATHLFKKKQKLSLWWKVGFVFFLLFLPNAPYIFTDVIHLYQTTQHVSSVKFLTIATAQFLVLELIGFWLFASTYHKFEKFVLKKKYYPMRYAIRMVAFLTISIGVYLGRFARINSWDIFFHPFQVARFLEGSIHLDAGIYILSFSLLLLLLYSAHESFSVS